MKFNYPKICSKLLENIPERGIDVIEKRFGLKDGKRKTLEAVGKDYGITRERVRQIEKEGFSKISANTKKYKQVFKHFDDVLKSFGDIRREDMLLSFLGGKKFQNNIFFLLKISDDFEKLQENKDFYPLWSRKKESANIAKKIAKSTIKKLESKKTLLSLEELFRVQKSEISKISNKKINQDIFNSYFEISKEIQKNSENKFGLKNWIEINPHGAKDRAYLVLQRNNKPLHFSQIADFMRDSSFLPKKETHIATIHNELIKDSRFVLVGRGIYALEEWGYGIGTVKDVILKILKESKNPLKKQEVLKKVSKQRIVKDNTIFLNLQNQKYFSKDSKGRYTVREA